MAEAVEVCCWQCSEYNTNFKHVLNIIIELKKKKISANFKNIIDRIHVGDENNSISEENLGKLLKYACEKNYVCQHTYKNNVSYRVNGKELNGECDICAKVPDKISDILAVEIKSTNDEKIISLAEEIKNKDKIINILIPKLTATINENMKHIQINILNPVSQQIMTPRNNNSPLIIC